MLKNQQQPTKLLGILLVIGMDPPWMSTDRKPAARLYRGLEKRFGNWSRRHVKAGEYFEELHCPAVSSLDVVNIMHLTPSQYRSAMRLIRSSLGTAGYFTATWDLSPLADDNAEVNDVVN